MTNKASAKGATTRLWLIVCVFASFAALMFVSQAAMANTVIEDWHEDGQIDGDYSPGQLQGALDSANPEEVEYSDLVEAIDQAMANALRKPGKGGGKGSSGGKTGSGSGKGSAKATGSGKGSKQSGNGSGKAKSKKKDDDSGTAGDSGDSDSGSGNGSDLLDFDDSQADKSSGSGDKSVFKSVVADHPYLSGLVLVSLLAIIAGLVRMFMLRAGAMPRYDGFLDD